MAASTASRASENGIRVRMRRRMNSPHSIGFGTPADLAFGVSFSGSSFDCCLPRYTYRGRRRIRAVIGRDFDHCQGLFAGILGFVWKFLVSAHAVLIVEFEVSGLAFRVFALFSACMAWPTIVAGPRNSTPLAPDAAILPSVRMVPPGWKLPYVLVSFGAIFFKLLDLW